MRQIGQSLTGFGGNACCPKRPRGTLSHCASNQARGPYSGGHQFSPRAPTAQLVYRSRFEDDFHSTLRFASLAIWEWNSVSGE